MKLKKILALALTAAMTLSLAGCGGDSGNADDAGKTENAGPAESSDESDEEGGETAEDVDISSLAGTTISVYTHGAARRSQIFSIFNVISNARYTNSNKTIVLLQVYLPLRTKSLRAILNVSTKNYGRPIRAETRSYASARRPRGLKRTLWSAPYSSLFETVNIIIRTVRCCFA